MTEQTTVEEEFTILPTVLIRMGAESMEVVTVGQGDREALVVFWSPEDAAGFPEEAGRYTADEGFERVGMGPEALRAVLEDHGLGWVHLAAPSGSDERGALFEAGNFIRLLEESPKA